MTARIAILIAAVSLWAGAALSLEGDKKCQAAKNKHAGKYAACLQKAEAYRVKKPLETARYEAKVARCNEKFRSKWNTAETNAGGACIDELPDPNMMGDFVTAHCDAVAAALEGEPLPSCEIELIACKSDLSNCEIDLGDCNSDLTDCEITFGDCNSDLSICETDLAHCNSDLGICNGDLTQCQADLGTCKVFEGAPLLPATGQVTSYGDGSDGAVQAGAILSFSDNEDGTISDLNTGLMWEKKGDDDSVHDKDLRYTWSTASPWNMTGTIKTAFIDVLNDPNAVNGCFAGHCDWRVPNLKELQSIFDYERIAPAVDPKFNNGACVGEGVPSLTGCAADDPNEPCSCTASGYYWSSTTYASGSPSGSAWRITFGAGQVLNDNKTVVHHVRAVRGGLPLTCNGISAGDPAVCSGHGECVAQDTCICDGGWGGPDCQNPT